VVCITAAIALQEAVTFELAQIVAELVQTVSLVGQVEGGQDGVVNLLRGPTTDGVAAVEQDLQEPNDARIFDPDTGVTNRANGDGEGHALQQREVDMDVEPLRLTRSETIRDGHALLPNGAEVVQAFLQAEVGEVVGADFIAQEGEELLVLLEKGVLEVGAKDMVAVLDLIDDGGQFAFHLACQPHAEDLADPVGGQPPQSEFAGALEDLVDGEVTLEDKVAAVFDLSDGVEARQVHLLPLFGGKLRPQ
jgi:hypothetical protein